MEDDSIYLKFNFSDETPTSFHLLKAYPEVVDDTDPSSSDDTSGPEAARTIQKRKPDESKKSDFESTIESFCSMMETYGDTINISIMSAPFIAAMQISDRLFKFVEAHGDILPEHSTDEIKYLKLSIEHRHKLRKYLKEMQAVRRGAKHLPQIAIIGLISTYDAYLSSLLRVIFEGNPQMIYSSERKIDYSELLKYESIEAARDDIVDQEIESVIRKSHHDQFSWMENKFSMPLRSGLEVWSDFIELCERRNLLTHTDGFVSDQYIKNCTTHKHKTDAKIGDRLEVNGQYFKNSIEIVSEIGIKLGHVLWRKFGKNQALEVADSHLNGLAMDLIIKEKYQLSQKILKLGIDFKKHHSDRSRRQMVVNLANAFRLAGDSAESTRILDEHDWSATSYDFQICVAAVRENIAEVVSLMHKIGSTGEIAESDYRDWPTFYRTRDLPEFTQAFKEIFGKDFSPKIGQIDSVGNLNEIEQEEHQDETESSSLSDRSLLLGGATASG